MEIFLQHIARKVFSEHGSSMDRVWMVFPGRRAALYFSRFLGELVEKPVWMPRMMTISELFGTFSGLQPADPLYANMQLYRVYSGLHPEPESFDDFFPWGEMVLNDFDETDKYLAEPADLFRNVQNLREIDDHFSYLSEEQREAIRWFWGAVPDAPEGSHASFKKLWAMLTGLYEGLTRSLREAGYGYDGMIYREVAGRIQQGEDLPLDAVKVYFVGFSALNACEKLLFNHLHRRGIASFFWDYDTWYTGDPDREAGYFLRNNLVDFPPVQLDLNFSVLNRPGREVKVVQTSSRMEEARILGTLLSETGSGKGDDPNHTAVVLADESLLMPVMYSLPSAVEQINITMGYPLRDAPVYHVLTTLFRLLKNRRTGSYGTRFYTKDVLGLLSQQMVRDYDPEATSRLTAELSRSNRAFTASSLLSSHPRLGFLFALPDETEGISGWLMEVLYRFFVDASKESGKDDHRMSREFIYHVYEAVGKLKELLSLHKVDLSFTTYLSLLKRYLNRIRIPFEGEPLAGLQVMGLMETRSLDFKNVVLLSAGEGFLPATRSRGSFIPYHLRRGFGLPVMEHQDSIYAYYFYRLLQRAENVWLVYTGTDQGMVTGEASRYIHQLRYDSRIRVADYSPPSGSLRTAEPEIVIPRTPEVQALLHPWLQTGNDRRSLSPSALNSFIDCSLKFYYRYVAGIREPELHMDRVDPATFGSLLHQTMKHLYQEKTGREMEKEWLTALEKDITTIDRALEKALKDVWFGEETDPVPGGTLLVAREVIREFVRLVIRLDREQAPLQVVALEKPYYMDFSFELNGKPETVRIGGTIDRVDRVEGRTRILDYKTGRENLEFRGIASLFEPGNHMRNAEAFQTILYAMVYRQVTGEASPVVPGLLYVRKFHRGNYDFHLTDKQVNQQVRRVDMVEDTFRERLTQLLQELFNNDQAFRQTENRKICEKCSYAEICGRKT